MSDMLFAQSYENRMIKKLYKVIKELIMAEESNSYSWEYVMQLERAT